jgi:hypothetical protein
VIKKLKPFPAQNESPTPKRKKILVTQSPGKRKSPKTPKLKEKSTLD